MTKYDIRILPYKDDKAVGFYVEFDFNGYTYTIKVIQKIGYIKEFLDVFTRALRVANKLVKKMEKTK